MKDAVKYFRYVLVAVIGIFFIGTLEAALNDREAMFYKLIYFTSFLGAVHFVTGLALPERKCLLTTLSALYRTIERYGIMVFSMYGAFFLYLSFTAEGLTSAKVYEIVTKAVTPTSISVVAMFIIIAEFLNFLFAGRHPIKAFWNRIYDLAKEYPNRRLIFKTLTALIVFPGMVLLDVIARYFLTGTFEITPASISGNVLGFTVFAPLAFYVAAKIKFRKTD